MAEYEQTTSYDDSKGDIEVFKELLGDYADKAAHVRTS
jgi:hypothetical protein